MQKPWGHISSRAGLKSGPPPAMLIISMGSPGPSPSPSVFSLSCADDASVQSVSQSRLSRCPAAPASFCFKETLEINYVITKFYPPSPHFGFSYDWKINDSAIEQVKSFKYLGIHFQPSTSSIHQISELSTTAQKASHAIIRFASHKGNNYAHSN